MKLQNQAFGKPILANKYFWDFDVDQIDWQASYKTIIARIVERGGENEWNELVRFYGRETIVNTLKMEINFLPDFAITAASQYFQIDKEDMLCYIRKQSNPPTWI
ncbi:MAG: hypothetical protein JSU01_19910 [Bacteroidetes bacterium]|nr:hypothetical protein [Bacteroidota bacterium]